MADAVIAFNLVRSAPVKVLPAKRLSSAPVELMAVPARVKFAAVNPPLATNAVQPMAPNPEILDVAPAIKALFAAAVPGVTEARVFNSVAVADTAVAPIVRFVAVSVGTIRLPDIVAPVLRTTASIKAALLPIAAEISTKVSKVVGAAPTRVAIALEVLVFTKLLNPVTLSYEIGPLLAEDTPPR